MSLGKHTAANLIGAFVPMFVALFTVPLYLHYVGVERYGVLTVLWVLLGYFGFLDFGFGRAVTKLMSSLNESSRRQRSRLLWTAIISTLFFGIFGCLFIWVGSNFLLTNIFEMSYSSRVEAIKSIKWFIAAFPFLLTSSVISGALEARFQFVILNIIQMLGTLLGQLLPIAAAIAGYIDLFYLVPIVLSARLLTIIIMLVYCQSYVPLFSKPSFDINYFKSLISYGGWMSIMSILAPLLVTVDKLIIASIMGASEVAHYSIPFDLVSRVMIVSRSFSSALFPRLASSSKEEGEILAQNASIALMAIMTPIVISGLTIVHPFIVLWISQEFAILSHGVAELIFAGVWINAIVTPHNVRFLAVENPKKIVLIYI